MLRVKQEPGRTVNSPRFINDGDPLAGRLMVSQDRITSAGSELAAALREYLREGNGAIGERQLAIESDGERALLMERTLCDSLESFLSCLLASDTNGGEHSVRFDGLLPVQIIVRSEVEVTFTGCLYVCPVTQFLTLVDAVLRLHPGADQMASYSIRFMPEDDFTVQDGDWSRVTQRMWTTDNWRTEARWRFQFCSDQGLK